VALQIKAIEIVVADDAAVFVNDIARRRQACDSVVEPVPEKHLPMRSCAPGDAQ
jgi:hypothetical protein